MATTNTDRNRDKRDGRYMHDFDARCRCGLRFGLHLAEPPYDHPAGCNGTGDEDDEIECAGFRRAK